MVIAPLWSGDPNNSAATIKDQHGSFVPVCVRASSADNEMPMTKPRTRRPLDDAELADADRLKGIYQRRKRELSHQGIRLTQEELAARCGWSGQSAVSQYLNAKVALNIEAALKFAKELGVDLIEISPRLAQAHGLHKARREHGRAADVDNNDEFTVITDFDSVFGKDKIELPVFSEVETAAGDGTTQVVENKNKKLGFSVRILERCGVHREDAALAFVSGDSMEPVLFDGSVVAIDKADTTIKDGKLYAIDHGGLLRVKVLSRLPNGGLLLKSFSDSHPDERYEPGWTSQISVLGRVFWSANEW